MFVFVTFYTELAESYGSTVAISRCVYNGGDTTDAEISVESGRRRLHGLSHLRDICFKRRKRCDK